MTESTNNSPLPLLLSVTGAILAVAGGGWYLLNQEPVDSEPSFARPQALMEAPLEETADTAQAGDETDESIVIPDIDAELRKARLAADADILVLPVTQSALYYYGRVLKSEPNHAVALAERDVILARTAQTVQRQFAEEDYAAAYELAKAVARQKPNHPLVVDTQKTLDDLTESLVADAIARAEAGDDAEARRILAGAQELPGRNPAYFDAVNESITEIRDVREAAERDRRQRATLANNEARAAWVDRIETAIAAQNLVTPAGASAHDLLSEKNSWNKERAELVAAFLTAANELVQRHIGERRAAEAEALLTVAETYTEDADQFGGLRAALEDLIVDIESNRVASMKELVRIKSAQPKYPERALKRELSGWVDVYFTVSESGDTMAIEVSQSEPKSVFDSAAIEAVEKWKFKPVEFRGRVIDQRAAARLVFQLSD